MSRSILITIDAAADAVRESDLCPIYELHINSISREKYKLEEPLFESTGNVVFPNFRAVRELAYQINKERGILGKSDQQIRAGKLNAIGLIDEINHYLVKYYNEIENPNAIQKALRFVHRTVGEAEVEKVLRTFAREFPPRAVYLERQTLDEYIESVIQNRAAREIVLEELIMLHLANLNPSFAAVKDLFDDSFLLASTAYQKITASLELFFQNEKPFGPDNDSLIGALKKPMLLHPDNIEAQLGYYKKQWGILLSAKYLEQIEKSFILTSEEDAFLWHAFNRGGGPPLRETFVPQYPKGIEGGKRISTRPEDYLYDEPERFTADTEWMPNVVLLAKNIHVWLDQLSKKYQRPIKRLQEIPDEELDRLAAWNFTGLWLIGVWERSHSSKMIKQINGNLDAVSSAYSLYDYEIAQDIGGEEAFQNLNHRARQRGIRLAGDMVPNHMGLYSKWVIEHPEYFIQSDRPPYPNYHFTGPNLSEDPNVEIRVEDGYWSKSDAAVVFQRIDKRYGDVRYLYHGNDGTSMPWNDTAQLNLLRADVREAVIQNIFHVARKFSIIRFDAAMTLAKKHFQRLWYPMPGTIGVPSRSDYGMSRPEFDAFFPVEFWREVVDRFKVEMPQTLLLAEAFWLMEGYFVRTLGMHRVYNSAFMHMLMKEENGKFAGLIKNTLEYNPEILKRYVNFMSNPDEETAVAQFGKDDKYFGTATLMVTLPGLPMFAHGQIEGFTEKYGMEYQRAYYNETPDQWLMERHEREIFPLMKRRHLFSQVYNFQYFDFFDDRGYVNEDLFAYSNVSGNDRAIVLFHNKFAEAKGWIRYSAPKANGEGGALRSVTLGEALFINGNNSVFYRFKDSKSSMEYLIRGSHLHERGFRAELHAFQYMVLMDFRELYDETGVYGEIADRFNGSPIANLDELICLHKLRSFHASISAFALSVTSDKLPTVVQRYGEIFDEFRKQFNILIEKEKIEEQFKEYFVKSSALFTPERHDLFFGNGTNGHNGHKEPFMIGLLFYLLRDIKKESVKVKKEGMQVISELCLENVLTEAIAAAEPKRVEIDNDIALLRMLLHHESRIGGASLIESEISDSVFDDRLTAQFLSVNSHEGITYFNKEQFERLYGWMGMVKVFEKNSEKEEVKSEKGKKEQGKREQGKREKGKSENIEWTGKEIGVIFSTAKEVGFQVTEFRNLLKSEFLLLKKGKSAPETPPAKKRSVSHRGRKKR